MTVQAGGGARALQGGQDAFSRDARVIVRS